MSHPGARLIGVAMGTLPMLVGIDVDPVGMFWLRNNLRRLNETLSHRTPRGGYHLIYKLPLPPYPVTVDNYNRAQSDVYFDFSFRNGAFGKFRHRRELMSVDKQGIIRPNRDTLNSAGVFDLDAGPVTIMLPDAGKRFMSMQVIGSHQLGGRDRSESVTGEVSDKSFELISRKLLEITETAISTCPFPTGDQPALGTADRS
jgi:Protein of unknown function (DUF1254)